LALADVANSLRADRDKIAAAVSRRGGRIGPVSGFVIPTLRRLGLYSERIDACFRDMFQALNVTLPANDGSGARVSPLDQLVELPEDLDAWVAARRV
jgi:hypothetical protein